MFQSRLPYRIAARFILRSKSKTLDTAERVQVKVTQRKYNIDKELTKSYVTKILEILNMSDYGVQVTICADSLMRTLYLGGKGKSKSTDVLAFAQIGFSAPEVISPVYSDKYFLGKVYVCPAYVYRQMEYDQYEFEMGLLDTSQDAGVSLAMATAFTVQERVPLLLVHAMLHLIGYDHETEEEWQEMVEKECFVLRKLAAEYPSIKLPEEMI